MSEPTTETTEYEPTSLHSLYRNRYLKEKSKREALEQQLSKVREIKPKESKPFIDDRECSWIDGWNECLEDVQAIVEKK